MRTLKVAVFLVLLLSWVAESAQAAARVTVRLQKDRLSINAREAALREILVELSRATGIQVYLAVDLEGRVAAEATTISFKGLTIEEGLRRLLRGKNLILVYSQAGLSEIRIYGEGSREFRRLTVGRPQPSRRAQTAQRAPRPPRGVVEDFAELTRLRAEALENPDPAARSAALDRLSRNEKLAVQTALEILERERDPEVLESALDILGGQESVPLDPLFKVATHPEPTVRLQALELLSEHGEGDSRVRDLLKKIVQTDRNREVRETARSLLESLQTE